MVAACSDDGDDGDDGADATSTTPVPRFAEPECDEDAQATALEEAFAEESHRGRGRVHGRIAEAAVTRLVALGEDGVLEQDCLYPDVRLRTAVTLRFLVNADGEVRSLFGEELENVPDQAWDVAEQLADAWYAADDPEERKEIGDALLTFLDEPSDLASSDSVNGLSSQDTRGIHAEDVDPLLTSVAGFGDYLQRYLGD